MAPQPEKLDRDSELMLYAAGEMQPAERELFERRLAAEPDLAADLARLHEAHRAFSEAFAHADEQSRLPASDSVTIRRVSRAIHQWQVEHVVAVPQPSKKGFPLPWWCYPATAAAMLIIGFLVWSSRQEVGPLPPSDSTQRNMQVALADADAMANWLDESVHTGVDAEADADEAHNQLSLGAADDLNASFLTPREENN